MYHLFFTCESSTWITCLQVSCMVKFHKFKKVIMGAWYERGSNVKTALQSRSKKYVRKHFAVDIYLPKFEIMIPLLTETLLMIISMGILYLVSVNTSKIRFTFGCNLCSLIEISKAVINLASSFAPYIADCVIIVVFWCCNF